MSSNSFMPLGDYFGYKIFFTPCFAGHSARQCFNHSIKSVQLVLTVNSQACRHQTTPKDQTKNH